MNDKGISSGDIALFRTTDGDWRVVDYAGDELDSGQIISVTHYWQSSLRDAMRMFGRLTARKPSKAGARL